MRDHPRRCGENKRIILSAARCIGSPPQVRGKLLSDRRKAPCIRITPAGAGKTCMSQLYASCPRDHPRRCGENFGFSFPFSMSPGSPPQVRGKHPHQQRPFQLPRITPAGAGKTPAALQQMGAVQDHPRRCGENMFVLFILVILAGSPPQVRGKRGIHCIIPHSNGITPAGAGKTILQTTSPLQRQDHPRRCGENSIFTISSALMPGSPPQVRGKLFFAFIFFAFLGITPAGAGKTI